MTRIPPLPIYPDWREQASCRFITDPEIFYDKDPQPALEVCSTCPVKDKCLQDALLFETDGCYGVRGGTTERQRRKMLRITTEAELASRRMRRKPAKPRPARRVPSPSPKPDGRKPKQVEIIWESDESAAG